MNIILQRIKKAKVPNITDDHMISDKDARRLIENSQYRRVLTDAYTTTYDDSGSYGLYGIQNLNARARLEGIIPLICICELYEFTNKQTKEAETIAIKHIVRKDNIENPELTYYKKNAKSVKQDMLSNGITYQGRHFITNKDLVNVVEVTKLNRKLNEEAKANVKK